MRTQVLMLEGPDGVGKSTLAERVGPSAYHHYGVPTHKHWEGEWLLDIKEDQRKGRRAVHDRGVYGNAVWADVIPGSPRLVTALNLPRIVRTVTGLVRHRVVILTRPLDDMVAELEKRGETDQQIGWALEAVDAYEDLADVLRHIGVEVRVIDSGEALARPAGSWWSW